MSQARLYRSLLWVPGVFLALTLGLALFIFLRNGFYRSGGMGVVGNEFTLDNIVALFDLYFLEVLLSTTIMSVMVVLACAVIGIPIVLYLRHIGGRKARFYFMIVLASSAMSLVVRALGWISILNDNGLLNQILLFTRIIDQPIALIGSDFSIFIGLLHGFLPIFVLTLYPIMQSIDGSLEQAAEGMGATSWEIVQRIILPLALPGIISASLLIFAMCMGAYTTPALLSGGRAMTFPMLIQQQAMVVLNYPMAAVLALVLMLIVLAITWASIAITADKSARNA